MMAQEDNTIEMEILCKWPKISVPNGWNGKSGEHQIGSPFFSAKFSCDPRVPFKFQPVERKIFGY